VGGRFSRINKGRNFKKALKWTAGQKTSASKQKTKGRGKEERKKTSESKCSGEKKVAVTSGRKNELVPDGEEGRGATVKCEKIL